MLHGSQKRFDKDGDGKLSMREWNSWYYYAVGADEDARKRRAAYAAAEQKAARERGHSTTADAAKAALKAGAKRLVIGHYSSRYKDENMLVEEARAIFPETYPATEGVTFTLEKQR